MEVAYPAVGMAATKSRPVLAPVYSYGSVYNSIQKKEDNKDSSNSMGMEGAFLNAIGIGEVSHLLEIFERLDELKGENKIQIPDGIMNILNGWMMAYNEITGVQPKQIVSINNAMMYGKINKFDNVLGDKSDLDYTTRRKLKL